MFKEINKKYKEYSNKLEEFDRIDLDKVGFNKCVDEREFIKDRLEFYYNLRKAVSKGEKKKMTQNEMVYDYLKKHGSISTYEAFTKLFITRLSARIFDIKRIYGIELKEEWITKKNRYGKTCSFKKYILEEE